MKGRNAQGIAGFQKSYTVDFLTKHKKRNEGEIPQYYVEGDYEAIIEPEVFDMVQVEVERRKGERGRTCGTPMSSRIKCAECGGWYGVTVAHSTEPKYRRHHWKCLNRLRGRTDCATPTVAAEDVERAFVDAANRLFADMDSVAEDTQAIIEELFDCEALESERYALTQEIEVVMGLMDAMVAENARIAQDQDD